MASSQAYAACSRDDVEFYLAKGFTNDQITTLCSVSSDSVNDQANATKQNNEENFNAATIDDKELFLKTAIKAKNIYLDNDSLHYTHEVCVEYGEEDLFGFAPKVCPQVEFIIALKGLEVIDTGKQHYFYGTEEIRIRSAVKREIIGELKQQKLEDRKLILEKIENGDKVAIPVREDFSLDRVKQVLLQLAN
jgi:hypothetical protein